MKNMNDKRTQSLDRRKFLEISAAVTASGESLSCIAQASDNSKGELIHKNERPTMTYRCLGRTNFMSSRLVFGCGAALRGGHAFNLLERAFEAGINHFDTGRPYGDSERQLAPFLKSHRDEIWITSKAAHMGWPSMKVTPDQGKEAAKLYTDQLEESLRELKTDYIDCYMLMMIDDPGFVKNEELHNAFLNAKKAGKVGCFGVSTHKNAQKVLEAAIETGWYSLVMPAITPAGWYDYETKELSVKTVPLLNLQPLLKKASEAGIGLIAMKAARMLEKQPEIFDQYYPEELKMKSLTPFQRSYTYILENGFDAANSHMPNNSILQDNLQVVRA